MIDHAIGAERERALLGALLREPGSGRVVIGELAADDFQIPAHREIFAAMTALALGGLTVGSDALTGELAQRGVLGMVGGAAAIADLTRARRELEAAITSVKAATAAIPPIWDEPV